MCAMQDRKSVHISPQPLGRTCQPYTSPSGKAEVVTGSVFEVSKSGLFFFWMPQDMDWGTSYEAACTGQPTVNEHDLCAVRLSSDALCSTARKS